MLRLLALSTLALCLVFPSFAQEADVPLPRRPPEVAAATPVAPEVAPAAPAATSEPALPRPRPDPATPAVPAAPAVPAETADPEPATPAQPKVDEPTAPPRDYQVACPAVLNGDVTATSLPPIHENMCGLQSPLSLEAVMANGRSVPLNAPVTTDCGMATALPGWIADVDRWLMATEKTRIQTVNVGTNYACRNVNNAKEGNLSFHAFGDAMDVIGFTLEDGRTISVETAWPGTVEQGSRIIRFAHDAACTHFTTVLGPEANELHRDHLHIDLGCHGQRCVARLCE
jgi:hypothetical protein